jgi:hypothetical protein
MLVEDPATWHEGVMGCIGVVRNRSSLLPAPGAFLAWQASVFAMLVSCG